MLDVQHPATPPPELVEQLRSDAPCDIGDALNRELYLITAAYRAGADAELEECCALIVSAYVRDRIRAFRRPKPPSLVKRALHILGTHGDLSPKEHDTIRQALEHLDD